MSRQSQRGVAMISMLLVFALVVVLVASATSRLRLDIRKSGFHQHHAQAYQYLQAGELLARNLLFSDWEDDQKNAMTDHLWEDWAQPQELEVENGLITVHIRDLESRLNINNLRVGKGKIDKKQRERLRRLFVGLGLEFDQLNLLIDWLDNNETPLGYDGEDNRYLAFEPGYRTANRAISHISELAALGSFTQSQLDELQQHLCALPLATTINPNTAGERVLASMDKKIKADEIIEEREEAEGFESNEAFAQSAAMGGGTPTDNFDVSSRFFEVWVAVNYAERDWFQRSVLYRDPTAGELKTLYRSLQRPAEDFRETEQDTEPTYSDT